MFYLIYCCCVFRCCLCRQFYFGLVIALVTIKRARVREERRGRIKQRISSYPKKKTKTIEGGNNVQYTFTSTPSSIFSNLRYKFQFQLHIWLLHIYRESFKSLCLFLNSTIYSFFVSFSPPLYLSSLPLQQREKPQKG